MNSVARAIRHARERRVPIGVLLVGAATVLPLVLGEFETFLATEILVLSVFAIGFNLAFGFTELYSFGHAAFFGLGAYAFALGLQHTGGSLPLAVAAVVVGPILYAVVAGAISTRGGGIYFALLTFAFAQGLYEFVIRTPNLTGATSGIFIVPPDLPFGVELTSVSNVYYLSLVLLVVTVLVGHRILNSPFGKVMNAIRSNPTRTEAIGYRVRTVRISVFALSGLISALAGVMLALQSQFVRPGMLYFERSVEVIVIVIIGGVSSLTGPIAGAVVLVLAEHLANDLADVGTVLIGAMFMLIIVFFPRGLAGLSERLVSWAERRDD